MSPDQDEGRVEMADRNEQERKETFTLVEDTDENE